MADKDEQLINLLEDNDEHLIDLTTNNETPAAQPSVPPSEIPHPLGPVVSPPPYSTIDPGSLPSVKCQVCQAIINIEENQQNVVKCQKCKESTPLRDAPRGMKFVRCPCSCLIVCKASARTVRCPRQNCKRETNLTGLAFDISVTRPAQSKNRVECVYCLGVFVTAASSSWAVCPHCGRTSCLSEGAIRKSSLMFLMIGLLFLGTGVAVTIATFEFASRHGGIFVVFIGAFISGFILIARAVRVATFRTSKVIGPAV